MDDDGGGQPAAPRQVLEWRHAVSAMMFAVVCICYADRTNMGVVLAAGGFAGVPRSRRGDVLSAFFVGYFLFQIPGGMIARRWGGKVALLLAVAIWTTCDVLTPFLAQLGFVPLYLGRVGMGVGEALVFPAQHSMASFWIPQQERSFLVGFMTSGQEFGSVLAMLVSPQLLKLGPPCVFVAWAVAAALWAAVFAALATPAPELHARCVQRGEASWIQRHRKAPHFFEVRGARARESPVPCRLLAAPSVWGIVLAHCGVNYAWYVILSWMPTFFVEAHGLDLQRQPYILACPYLAGFVGTLIAGRACDALIARGFRVRLVRKGVQLLGALGVAVFLQLSARAHSVGWAGAWMLLALFFGRMQTLGFWVNMLDVCPESAVTLMGFSNTVATIPGIVGQPITQAILDSSAAAEPWALVFAVGGAVSLAGALGFALLGDEASLDGPASPGAAEGSQKKYQGLPLASVVGSPGRRSPRQLST